MGFREYQRVACTVLIALIIQHIIRFCYHLQIHKNVVFNHAPGPCHHVPGIDAGLIYGGSEKIKLTSSGMAYITSGALFGDMKHLEVMQKRRGAIFRYDTNKPGSAVTLMQLDWADKDKLVPLGMDIYEDDAQGQLVFFVVNLPVALEHGFIEKFTLAENSTTLVHVETISDPTFRYLDDVVALDRNKFYVTNLEYGDSGLSRKVELLLLLHWGDVVYYNGRKGKVIVDQLRGPNGIALSPDRKYVYVVMALDKELHIYERWANNTLDLKEAYNARTNMDNVYVDPVTGDLWVAGCPVAWKMLWHMERPLTATAPSQVLHLKMEDGSVKSVEEVYSNDGSEVTGATGAVYKDGQLLIGSLAHRLIHCQVTYLR